VTSAAKRIAADAWNGEHPVGTWVRYWPILPPGPGSVPIFTRTRSRAWVLGGHTPVVQVEHASGCVALSHLEIVQTSGNPLTAPAVVAERTRRESQG